MARRQNAKNKNHSYGCEKKVYQYDINGHLIKIWKSLMEVSRELHIPWVISLIVVEAVNIDILPMDTNGVTNQLIHYKNES